MPIEALTPDRLRHTCHHKHFNFKTTADLTAIGSIIGQPRGTRAIEFGISINSHGYNIYILGDTRTGRTTAIKRFLYEKSRHTHTPSDWIYVHNFDVPHRPRAIELPAGQGAKFQQQMEDLLEALQEDLPKAFGTDAYQDAVESITQEFEDRRTIIFDEFRGEAAQQQLALVNTASGLMLAPTFNNQILSPADFNALPDNERQAIQERQKGLSGRLKAVLDEVNRLDGEMRQQLTILNETVAINAIEHHFEQYRDLYREHDDVLAYLLEFRQDILNYLDHFAPSEDEGEEETAVDFRRYAVNLLVDNGDGDGAPVIVESNPTFHNLLGRIEYEARYGTMTTDFTNLKAGSLHQANGGYLIINAHDLLQHGAAWQALKRAIITEEISLQAPESQPGGPPLAKSLDPEPIPLKIKIILLGSPGLYYALYEQEEDFDELFKVKADFRSTMPRTDENEYEYALFIANRCNEENLQHFAPPAVEKIVEHGSRLAGDQRKLSTRFGLLADIVREASYWSGQNGRSIVTAEDVRQALNERVYRANLIEEQMQEQIDNGTIFLDTTGAVVGQVNALSVLDVGDHAFGRPGRITARTYMGKAGVVNIEREVELAGPLHNKGLLILTGYLGATYAQEQPLSLSASLTFEQNYGGVDGDSASSTELYALLSSLSGVPIKQNIAVTGSVNQRGEIQPIGGATEKIEGFFAVCKAQGLTGAQGVMIPAANSHNLMLDEEVVEAVAADQFHIWTVATIDDGLALLTGVEVGERGEDGRYPAGTLHARVQQRLYELAEGLESFGK